METQTINYVHTLRTVVKLYNLFFKVLNINTGPNSISIVRREYVSLWYTKFFNILYVF